MVRLIPLLRQPSRKDLFDALQPVDALPKLANQEAASGVFTAARSCGLLTEDADGGVRLQVSSDAVETLAGFRRHMQQSLLGITDDGEDNYLLNIYCAWYAAQDDRVFKFDQKDFEVRFNEALFPDSEARRFNTTKLRGWLVWAAFLGHGWPLAPGGKTLLVPDARTRVEPLLSRLLPEGQSAVRMGDFMEQLGERCPELDGGTLFKRCAQVSRTSELFGNRMSLMLSNALRVLDTAGSIRLMLQADAPVKWQLYPAAGHRHQQISHIQLGRAA
jgi:hypothetical protein